MIRSLVSKTAVLSACAIAGTTLANAQNLVAVQQRLIPGKNIEEFVKRETTYWSEIARQAVKDGKLVKWELWRAVGGEHLDEAPNFMFVNIFSDDTVLDDMGAVWDAKKVFPNRKMADMETQSLGTLKSQYFYRVHGIVGTTQAQILRVNLARVSSVGRYLQLEDTVWRPFIQGCIDSGKTKVTSWAVASLIAPRGTSVSHNAVTVDGYQKLSDAFGMSFDADVDFPDLKAIGEVREMVHVQYWALVKAVGSEQ